MKILQVCPAFYPAISIGGPIFTILSLQRLLATKNHIVDVLSTPLGLSQKDRASIVYNKPMTMPVTMSVPGVITYQHFYGYPHFTFSPQSFWWLFKNIEKYDMLILHGVWNFPILAAALVCRIKKVPYFVVPHGTLYKETIELRSALLKKTFLKLYVERMLVGAKRILFTTRDERDKVTNFLQLDFSSFVLPNIVRSAEFKQLPVRGEFRRHYSIPADAPVLLHYGRISRKKGIEFSIQALAKLSSEFPDAVLAVVGGDEEGYRAVIERCAKDWGVQHRVIFTAMVERKPMGMQAMVDADIFVLPSLSENFGMAVVEAMQCGLPVVISNNVGLAPDIGSAGAGLVVSLTPDNEPLANAIAGLLRSPEERRALGEKGKNFAIEHYDDQAVASIVDELLALV
ncbi:MAG: glycosyltransferase [Pseudomonadota bacterium]